MQMSITQVQSTIGVRLAIDEAGKTGAASW